MTPRRLITAMLIALLVSGLFTFWLSKRLNGGKSIKVQYVAPVKDFDAGDTLRLADLQRVNWPSDTHIDGAFTKLEDVVGRTLLFSVAQGQPLQARQLTAPGMGAGLSTKIPDGMRAISLKSDQIVGVAGFLSPGTRIDVLVTYRTSGSAESVTSTVLQDARVIAAGQKTEPDPDGKATTVSVVTLLVSPPDAEKVVLASTQGTVHFILRNGSDHEHVNSLPVQMSELGEVPRVKPAVRVSTPKPSAPVLVKPYSVETFRGDKHTVENFN
jgi:pilus assembly protein CpaB